MDFSKLLSEQEYLVKGKTMLAMDVSAPLRENARAVNEQRRDILYILSDLPVEQLEAFDEALEEAIEGFMAFADGLNSLHTMAQELKESDSPDVPRIGEVLDKVRAHAIDQGSILKSLKQVCAKFNIAAE